MFLVDGGASSEGVPPRVLQEIARREDAAEQLIGWVQLAIVVAFAALYFAAPRAEGSSGQNFVPATLFAYFLFTVLRIGLSYRFTLPWWYLILSIFTDVLLLCGLIFSFHIQYSQPVAFSLKVPTMVYLFIFIALRALRFDPRYVLVAGLTAAGGWFLMVLYALQSDMGEMHITRNFVEYLTSNSILIGAEIDKIVTLLGVTFILSLALYRARFMGFIAARSSSAAEDLRRFFAPEVFNSITNGVELPGSGHCETRQAAVLFVDVRGFTPIAESLPAATVMQVLAHYQQTALAEIQRFDGRVDKFLGDGILATFGAVQTSETYAADALRAAEAVVAALDTAAIEIAGIGWPGVFRIGAAVAAGPLTVGVIGASGRLEYTVIGNPVNLAAKLENANKAQRTRALTDLATFEIARAQGYSADLPLRHGTAVAGMAHLIDLAVVA